MSLKLSMSNAALQQAQAEKLTLLVAESKTGYYGVYRSNFAKPGGRAKLYQAHVRRVGKTVYQV